MAASNASLNLQSNCLTYPEAGHKFFGVDLLSSLQLAPRPQRPIRIAVIGNHLPRQCGIATFTTDLCDAIAAEYKAAQLPLFSAHDLEARCTVLYGRHSAYSCPS
jgi:hypothetical protein